MKQLLLTSFKAVSRSWRAATSKDSCTCGCKIQLLLTFLPGTPCCPWTQQRPVRGFSGCHGLAPWRITLAATQGMSRLLWMPRACLVEVHVGCYIRNVTSVVDATGLPRGGSRWQLHKECRVCCGCHGLAPWRFTLDANCRTATNRTIHGASPWDSPLGPFPCSCQPNNPQDKPVGFRQCMCRTVLPRTRQW